MRPPRPRMTHIDCARIAALIDPARPEDAPVDNAIGRDGTGTRPAHMDLGVLVYSKLVTPDTPRSAHIALQLLGPLLDLDIPRAAHRQIRLIGPQPHLYPAAARIAYPHRRALEHIIGTDTTRP